MDAKTHIKGADIKGRLPSRHVTQGSERAPHRYFCAESLLKESGLLGGSVHAAPHPANECEINLFEVAEIFKKTPCAAGLKPGGRYVAKDMYEVDVILVLDAEVGTSNVKLSEAELTKHKTKWQPRATNHKSGALWKFAQQVGPAVDGAMAHPGGAHEKQCYADI